MEHIKHTALEWLGQLHYQICNGGLSQACFNGYVDRLIEAYGSVDAWVDSLKRELGDDEHAVKAVDAARLIATGVAGISMSRICPDCEGAGSIRYEEEDDDGESVECEDTCTECGGSGMLDVDTYAEVDFEIQGKLTTWDGEYYSKVDSDTIDDLTNQSHNHSVILDMLQH